MKKIVLLLGICGLLLAMPMLSATTTTVTKSTQPSIQTEEKTTLPTPPIADYDGTFLGGIGEIFFEDEWQFDYQGYLAGVYKLRGRFNILYGYLYNLEEEQVGYIGAFFGNNIIIGYVEDMNDNRAPIIGFLFYNDENFAGRIMSLFGPAPHIWGVYTPN